MRRITAGLAAGIALAIGVLGGAVGTAALADEVPADEAVSERVEAIADALAGLVSEGTITQEQADAVAGTLGESDLGLGHGRGPHAGHVDPEAVADAVGLTVDELRSELQDGSTLAEVAEEQGISRADLVDGLVAAAETELDQRVEDGHLTTAQADTIREGLSDRIDEAVDREPGARRGHFGPGGRHGGHGWPGGDGADGSAFSGSTT